MKKIHLGILLGICAGILDLIPMILQNLTWDANLSAFSLWIVSGFLISTSNIKIKAIVKGIIISFLILIPNLFIIGWNNSFSLVPIVLMTLVLGALLGFLIEKYGK
ncbi:MAG: hypothetical protein V1663_00250 [archaeon]